MQHAKPKVLVIAGATASGKTSLSIQLAKKFNGEVISADSRQIYKGLDIGTGKVTQTEMQGVPHHCIDIIEPTESYTASEFKDVGRRAIADITKRGALPIIAGGTFFYVDTLLGKVGSPEVPPNPALRAKLESRETADLYKELEATDPQRAADVDPQNKRRIVRALEIATTLGSVPRIIPEEPYDVLTLGIHREKEVLRDRFKQRAQQWLQEGFMDEIKSVLDSGLSAARLQEIGFEYILGIELYKGSIIEEVFLQKFIEKNWQYAKRQNMWLKKDETIVWVDTKNLEETCNTVQKFLST